VGGHAFQGRFKSILLLDEGALDKVVMDGCPVLCCTLAINTLIRIFTRMRTTIDLPDPLFHRVKLASVQRRVSLKQLIAELLESSLSAEISPPRRMTAPPIVLERSRPIPALSNREAAALLDTEDTAKFGGA